MARVLVTGGAGYIGSHAVRALRANGHDVVVLDDLSAGHAESVPEEVPLVRARIHDRSVVTAVLHEHGIDAVMHFAAWLSVADSVRDPLAYYENNVVGSLALFAAMAEAGVKRLVFSSTCAVYGEPATIPIVETEAMQPISAYGETKLTVERALAHLDRAIGLRWIALRYFNAAGAHPDGTIGEDHHPEIHLIPRAIDAAIGGAPLQLFGEDYPTPDGTCLRDYIHVCDLADAHVCALGALEG
ncbi:MAG: UDP-glucose 4-epimerase GalE, partial [Vicinamibacterales bacterium]